MSENITVLEAEGTTLPMPGVWHPIDTAPSDRPCIVWPDYWGHARVAMLGESSLGSSTWYAAEGPNYWDYDPWYWREGRNEKYKCCPLYWMELPEAPWATVGGKPEQIKADDDAE